MKIKTWQYIVMGLLALLAVGFVAASAWMTPYDLTTEQAAARAAGLPLTSAGLARQKPPAHRDAGPDWLAFAALLEKKPINDDPSSTYPNPLPPAAMPELRRLLDERSDVMSLIHRATDKPDAYFEHTFASSESLKQFVPMRQAAKMLRWEAMMHFREGRFGEAVAVQARGFRVADHCGTDPLIISHLISLAIEAITLAGFEDMLLEAGPDPRVTAPVRRAVASNPSRRNRMDALRAEALFGVNGIRDLRTLTDVRGVFGAPLEDPAPASKRGAANPLVVHYVARQGEAAYLTWYTRMYQAERLPTYAARMAARNEVERAMNAKRLRPPGEMVAALMVPVFTQMEAREMAAVANRRVLLAACDVLDHRARTGTWPPRLEDASARPPVDPFTGKPVVYRWEGSGFVLYSVGADGTFAAKPGQDERGQAVFRYAGP